MTQTIIAQTRDLQGRGASRRLRKAGKLPGIIYGADKEATLINLDHNTIFYAIKKEAFHSSILNITVDGKEESVVLRDFQTHPYKQLIMHIDFQRVSATEEISMKIPLHYINDEISPAVKTQGAHINRIQNDVEVRGLAANIPQFIDVDLAAFKAGETLHLSSLKLPKGLSLVNLLRGEDSALVSAGAIVEVADADTSVSIADIPTIEKAKEEA